MAELKPCPFCGGRAVLNGGEKISEGGGDYWWVQCHECFASTHGNADRETAIEAWNRRASDG